MGLAASGCDHPVAQLRIVFQFAPGRILGLITKHQQVMLYEEEIADVMATFHVFDKERAGIHRPRARLAMGVGGCGCAGCGCACGIGLYYHYTPPVLGDPVDPPPPRPIRPAHKYKSNTR